MDILKDTTGNFGRYINKATEYANYCIAMFNLDEKEVINMAQQEFSRMYRGKIDMVNTLIAATFHAIGWAVENTYGINSDDIEYSINGKDSHIYYKKEELIDFTSEYLASESAKEIDY